MACIVAALRTNDYISLGSKDINIFALAFIAPLGTQYNFAWHKKLPLSNDFGVEQIPLKLTHMLIIASFRH